MTFDIIEKFSKEFGLTITEEEARELTETTATALKKSGRIEFGPGIAPKIMRAFCDSPYIDRETCMETINELVEIFYYYKSETKERISDDELIRYMKKLFNGVCKGSLELLADRELYELAQKINLGEFDD